MLNLIKKNNKIFLKFASESKKMYFKFLCGPQKDGSYFLSLKIPSFTKWESSNLVDDIRQNKISAKDDPLWKESGAENLFEYESYSWQICGMICLKMILAAINPNKKYPSIYLAKKAEKFGVYKKNNNPDLKQNLDGMFHIPFLKFIGNFDLFGFRKTMVRDYQLCYYLNKQFFVMTSVSEDFALNQKKGGHMVVVVGYEIKNKKISGFYVNNPSGKSEKIQAYFFVKKETWDNNFSGNVICISKLV